MPSYKGKNLPDGKIQILQDGKEFAIVNTLEEAKALIKGLGMRLEAPPIPPARRWSGVLDDASHRLVYARRVYCVHHPHRLRCGLSCQ
jgi:hypothetical protein